VDLGSGRGLRKHRELSLRKNTRKCSALDTRNLRRALRPEEFSKPWTCSKKEGTRELVIPSLPYIIVYHVRGDAVHRAHPAQFAGLAMMSGARSTN
jgi:hypothetical protein